MPLSINTLENASSYITAHLEKTSLWDAWHILEASTELLQAQLLPWVSVMHLPKTGALMFDPFTMKESLEPIQDRTTWLLVRSFSRVSEARYRSINFSATAAKLLTYYRLCFISSGCAQEAVDVGGSTITLAKRDCDVTLDAPAIDPTAFSLAQETWPLLILTVVGAYMDSGYALSTQASSTCEKYWRLTPWPKMFEAHDLSWPQIIQYLFKSFSPTRLLAAAAAQILLGRVPTTPIFDVATYTIEESCLAAMISPWGQHAAAAWWQQATAHAGDLIKARRVALGLTIKDFGTSPFSQRVTDWIANDFNPFLDTLRIVTPIILVSLRPMYMPNVSSNLYIHYYGEDTKIAAHANAFAEVAVGQLFNQPAIEATTIAFEALKDLDSLKAHMKARRLVGGLYTQNEGAIVRPPSSIQPWHTPNIIRPLGTLSHDDIAGITRPNELWTSFADAFGTMTVAGSSDEGGALHEASDEPPITEDLARDRALARARKVLQNDRDWRDHDNLSAIMEKGKDDPIFNSFMRPTLVRAKKAYDKAMK